MIFRLLRRTSLFAAVVTLVWIAHKVTQGRALARRLAAPTAPWPRLGPEPFGPESSSEPGSEQAP